MLPQTEALLTELQQEFNQRKKGHKSAQKINYATFVEAKADGMTHADALALAGSEIKDRDTRRKYATTILKRNPQMKEAIEDIMDTKLRQTLRHMTADKAERASYGQLAMSAGILADKRELLSGRPTQRQTTDVDFRALIVQGKMDKRQLQEYIQQYLSGSQALPGKTT